MYKPIYSPSIITLFPTYVPIFETYFLQNLLPRWNQILTQLRLKPSLAGLNWIGLVLNSTTYRPLFRIPVELMASGFTYHMQTHVVFKDFIEFIFPEFKKKLWMWWILAGKTHFPIEIGKFKNLKISPKI